VDAPPAPHHNRDVPSLRISTLLAATAIVFIARGRRTFSLVPAHARAWWRAAAIPRHSAFARRHSFIMMVGVFLVACAASAPPPAGQRVEPQPYPDCGRNIRGAERAAGKGTLLLLGELIGTREFPEFVGDLACQAARHVDVTIGLNLPEEEDPRVQRYVASPGTASDRDALLDGEFWRHADGRSGEAIVALIERVRRLTHAGAKARIAAVWASGRERFATNVIRLHRERPNDLVIILAGNLEVRTTRDKPATPELAEWDVPMGWYVARAEPAVLSLDGRHLAGTAWNCLGPMPPKCGPRDVGGQATDDEHAIVLNAETDSDGYRGTFSVGAVHASPPARRDVTPWSSTSVK
jgi:hypothetical protein